VARTLTAVTDADEIRNTIARFAQCLDDRRFKEFSETFAEDGAFADRKGRQAIYDWISKAELASRPELKRKHAIVNVIVEVDGDRATSTSDLVMFDQVGDGPVTIRTGRYTDELAKQPDGRWLIKLRNLNML
jgi:ketosteroid isomerase-like protein